MLDDHAGRVRELLDALECRIAISDVVVRQRFALELPGSSKRSVRGLLVDIEGSLLVRVLAVTELLGKATRVQEAFAKYVITQ